jgi:hypothetical protein
MAGRPILVFPEGVQLLERAPRHASPPADIVLPSRRDQATLLLPKFKELARKLRERELAFIADPTGVAPSQILVFELVGTVTDFYRVVRRINGLEWLLDDDAGQTDPGQDFYLRDDPTAHLSSRLLAVSANQTALADLLKLFRRFRRGEALPHGFGKFNELFLHVRDVRPWEFRDRIAGTGIVEYVEQLARIDRNDLLCGIELFSAGDEEQDTHALDRIRAAVDRAGGTIHASVILSAIRHGELRATIPLTGVASVAAMSEVNVFQMDDVMFVRPAAQAVVQFEEEIEPAAEAVPITVDSPVQGAARLALFDGMPVQNHPALVGRLIIDDPDGLEADAPVLARRHGTAMSSIILNGDLSDEAVRIPERIYVRPILVPRATRNGSVEEIPETAIPVDVLHRAVVRLFEGEDAVARSVRVICLCVADRTRPLENAVSPWARLVDFLSWKYGVLFLLSAGNYPRRLIVDNADLDIDLISPADLDQMLLESFVDSADSRSVMSPGEAVNALTIAASCHDLSTAPPNAIVPFAVDGHLRPALFNAVGYGYRRAIKPDVLFPGGRMAFRLATLPEPGTAAFDGVLSLGPPGNEVAAPPRTTGFLRGTSNATAFASRDALELLTLIDGLGAVEGDCHLEAALLKALIVHSASWGTAYAALSGILRARVRAQAVRQNVARFVGYGFPNIARSTECTQGRVTVIAADRVLSEQALLYRFPLPPAMAARRVRKRLITTLAYLCPMNPTGRIYRTHNVWLSASFKDIELKHSLDLVNQQVHEPYVGLGTLQHEILTGSGAVAFVDGDGIQLQVNCKRDSGGRLDLGVPFAIAVTLELLDEIGADIYQEVRERMAVPVEITGVTISV